jgi:TolA-binding protein
MGKQNFLFVIFCTVLISGLMQSYFTFKEYFSPHKDDLRRIAQLEKEVEEKNLKIVGLETELVDFRQEVASQLPALKKIENKPATFQLRTLASVTQKPIDAFDLSGSLIEKARAEFRRGEFKTSAQSFASLTKKFPTSPVVVQAYFFWAESLYMSGQHQECLDVVDQMMTQFPDHELTGFVMLRMGQILQTRNRGEEAGEVYRIVEKNFGRNNHELKVQAQKLEQSVEL